MKIGFFGGCFNPPTFAHINLAKKALLKCDLDKIIFVPIGDFYKKPDLVSARHRYNMLKIACKYKRNIEVTDIELNIQEKIYAIDAFNLIEQAYPRDELYFIMGADNFIKIINWKDSNELLQKYKYIVLNREDINIEEYIKEFNINSNKVIIIKNENYRNLSSSKFREITKDEEIYTQDIIQDSVLDYIIENNLYKF